MATRKLPHVSPNHPSEQRSLGTPTKAGRDVGHQHCRDDGTTTPLKPTAGFPPSEPSLAGDPGLNGPPNVCFA